jgi:hypothetical protein
VKLFSRSKKTNGSNKDGAPAETSITASAPAEAAGSEPVLTARSKRVHTRAARTSRKDAARTASAPAEAATANAPRASRNGSEPVHTRASRTDAASSAPQQVPESLRSGRLELLVTVVNRPKADFYVDLLQGFEVNLMFSAPGEGTAGAQLGEVLGLANTGKTVIFSIIREDRSDEALDTLSTKFRTINGGKGIAFTVPLTGTIGVLAYGFMSNNEKLIKDDGGAPGRAGKTERRK